MKPYYLVLLALWGVGLTLPAQAEVTEDQAIRAILGEDSGSFEGMYAVACGIRNRGTLKGVYGVRAVRWVDGGLYRFKGQERKEEITPELYQRAGRAWAESKDGYDVTMGSKHWEGATFKTPYWTKGKICVGQIGGNVFYREPKK